MERVSADNKSGNPSSGFCRTLNIFPAIMVCAGIDTDTVACGSQSRTGGTKGETADEGGWCTSRNAF